MLLQLQQVSKSYASHKAVNQVTFQIPKGCVFGLLGPNGAGKTTIIRMITGITMPDSGMIIFNGKNSMGINTSIGYMPEERGLYKKMKIGEQLMFLAELKGLSKLQAKQNIDYWLQKFDITAWYNKNVEDLSKGMQQKIQFIATVLHQPDLLILDEPFTGLDPINAKLIEQEIFDMARQGKSIIFSTHRLEQVDTICDELVLINKGENILEGNVETIKQQFKQNEYKVKYAGNIDNISLSEIDIQKREKNEIWFRLFPEQTANNVLQTLIQKEISIISFEEILPTVNEIFIKCVNQASTHVE